MKTESRWNLNAIAAKSMAVLVLAALLGGAGIVPANARDDFGHMDRYEKHHKKNTIKKHDRDHYYVGGRRVYRPEVYRERIYVPPPVYYAPPPPPGVSIFLPPFLIHL